MRKKKKNSYHPIPSDRLIHNLIYLVMECQLRDSSALSGRQKEIRISLGNCFQIPLVPIVSRGERTVCKSMLFI